MQSGPPATELSQSLKSISRPVQHISKRIEGAADLAEASADPRIMGFARAPTAPLRIDPRLIGLNRPEHQPPSRDGQPTCKSQYRLGQISPYNLERARLDFSDKAAAAASRIREYSEYAAVTITIGYSPCTQSTICKRPTNSRIWSCSVSTRVCPRRSDAQPPTETRNQSTTTETSRRVQDPRTACNPSG